MHAGNLMGVLDGVTQPPGLVSGCQHGAAWYSARLAARLADVHGTSPQCALTDLLAEAIAVVRGDHGGHCDLGRPTTPAAAVCLLRASPGRADFLLLCDTTLVVESPGGVRTMTDHRLAGTISRLRTQEQNSDTTSASLTGESAEERAVRYALVKSAYTNRPEGYWIAAADPAAAEHAQSGTLPLDGPDAVTRAALLTDGAARAVDVFSLFGWLGLLGLLAGEGPQALVDSVRKAEYAAARNGGLGAEKAHDDATVGYIEF
ncbi:MULTISPECIES: hypothetical protein [Streptomyces]|uniref:hypothetical protein n=1 Tax=Streptomyces TaxID=1883 RepID=UPI001B332751|nr:hypothetical protein [Streptomyces sp. AgN23]QTI90613.1 hypothetical protein AS97_61095 [Streptomyces sp. AgN23]WTA78561.1 hypothetical protein OG751_00185 [Streptomyces antimycoticus]WTA86839.1 hypothetical protein OG751_47600 [Streptomyces antimycoticus]